MFLLNCASALRGAEDRIKTVQYSFGSYYSSNGTAVGNGTDWAPSSLDIWLPEESKSIKSAFIEVGFLTQSLDDILGGGPPAGIDIKFDNGASASTVRDSITGDVSYQTGEFVKILVRADVTSVISNYFDGDRSSGTFSAAVSVNGADTQAHSAKIYITYEYDPTSATQVRTVRYPLDSKTSRLGEGTYSFSYTADIADTNVDVKKQWFEIKGLLYPLTGGKFSFLYSQVGADTPSPTMTIGGDEDTGMEFFYIDHQGNGISNGFAINTAQTVNIDVSREPGGSQGGICFLGGEVFVTYVADGNSATKTRTVSYFLGQGEYADATEAFTDNFYLAETGISFNNIYALINGSFNSGTSATLNVTPYIDGNSGASSGYTVIAEAPTVSGFSLTKDFSALSSYWNDGDIVEVDVANAGTDAKGASSVELIATYDFTGEGEYTNNYQAMAGHTYSKTNSTSAQISFYWPEVLGVKNLRNASVRENFHQTGAATGQTVTTYNPSTTIDIDGSNSITVPHRTQDETHYGTHLYEITEFITVSTATADINYSISAEDMMASGKSNIIYTYLPPPNSPVSLVQYEGDGATEISSGTFTDSEDVILKFTVSSPLSSDSLTPKVELRTFGETFTGTSNYTGAQQSYAGSPLISSVTISGLTTGSSYYWQCWVTGDGGASAKVSFGGYPSNFDFAIDTAAPVVSDNQTGDDSWQKEAGAIYDVDFDDDLSLLDSAQHAVYSAPSQGGSLVIGWTEIFSNLGSATYTADWSVDFANLKSSYNYVSVRVWDNSGSTVTKNDVFYIKKDTTTPVVSDNQTGDDSWQKEAGAVYDVDFDDDLSFLDSAQYAVYSAPSQGGSEVIGWTDIFSNLGSATYTADWSVDFANLKSSYNYVSVRAWDNSGSTAVVNDVFYIKKDTTTPVVSDNQTGDDSWQKEAGAVYDVDFDDDLSFLDSAQYAVYSAPSQGGSLVIGWTDIFSNLGSATYTADWSVDFANLKSSYNYVSVRAWDNSGSTVTENDVFYIKKDTTTPVVSDNQTGDDSWQKESGATYNVDFDDDLSFIDNIKYRICSATGNLNPDVLLGWTDIEAPGYNQKEYLQNWGISFGDCQEGTNYISVEVYDTASNTETAKDVFYVKKDITSPGITDNQLGDDNWRNKEGTLYDVDFTDTISKLEKAEYRVTSGLGQTGDEIIAWTDIFTSTGTPAYNDNWSVLFSSLTAGTNYVSVRDYDQAGNSYSSDDVFYVMKDTNAPAVSDNQTGDDNWISSQGTTYDIDFSDVGGSLLERCEYRVYDGTDPASSSVIIDWTVISDNINADSYTSDWQVDFNSLVSSYNYVSVRAYDNAGSSGTSYNVFFIKKDTAAPQITDNQTGDDIYRMTRGTTYDVDFSDMGSLLDNARYTVYSAPGKAGENLKAWTNIFSSLNNSNYTGDWEVDFTSLNEGVTNYVSVDVYDNSGNTAEKTDAFYILKDTTSPNILDNQQGDDTWRNSGETYYDIDFKDLASGLNKAEYTVWGSPSMTGSSVIGWTVIFDTDTFSKEQYLNDWQVDFNSLAEGSTNYVTVRVYDNVGNAYSQKIDAFYILKDVTPPSVIDNQSGDDTEYSNDPGDIFNIDFTDSGESGLDRADYIIYTDTGAEGTKLKDWTQIFDISNSTYYLTDWGIDFGACGEGYNYVSVRAYDNAGSSVVYSDVFYVRKAAGIPNVYDNQAGDDNWRVSNTGYYNIDFSSNSSDYGLDYAQTSVWSGVGQTGVKIDTWTTVLSNINAPEYTADWQIINATFDKLIQGKNYISVRVYQTDGTVSAPTDVFYIMKDTAPPAVVDNQTGDNIWRNSAGTTYNINFNDETSGLSGAQYAVWSSPGKTGSGLKSWTIIFDTTTFSGNNYTTDWEVDFNSLNSSATNYVSVRVIDIASTSYTYSDDVFYVLKDTAPPSVIDNQSDINPWQNDNTFTYDIDIDDTGGSKLDYFQIKACSAPAQVGLTADWTTVQNGIDLNSYTDDWSLPAGFWQSLKDETTNYITLRAYDTAGNVSAVNEDIFFVRKDTSPPAVVDNQTGDDAWRKSDGAVYNIDFNDYGSLLSAASYSVWSSTEMAGVKLATWTYIASSINAAEYTSNWEVLFSSLNTGTNYVTVKTKDIAGNTAVSEDVFYVKKDTAAPAVSDNQTGDDIWKKTGGAVYDVDFTDSHSLLDYIQYTVYDSTQMTGNLVKDWTYIASGINDEEYITDWQIDFSGLNEGKNYISVRAFDNLTNATTSNDVFYLLKDITQPNISDLQTGDNTWRNSNTGTYNIDFADSGGSDLNSIKYKIALSTDGLDIVVDWYSFETGLATDSYTSNWQIEETHFQQLPQGKVYLSVKGIDTAGNYSTLNNAFYILKDTAIPIITDNQTGDDTWRNSNSGVYDADFSDTGGSNLNYLEYKISTATAGGATVIDWYSFQTGLTTDTYITDFLIESSHFDQLPPGKNYVSVRANDSAGNSALSYDIFYIYKDTIVPVVTDNQTGDDNWRNTAGTVYDVDFTDSGGSYIDTAYYRVAASTGGESWLSAWNVIDSAIDAPEYTTDWDIDFSTLTEGKNYISVKVLDFSGNLTTVNDLFYVKKDTRAPVITDNQIGDNIWRNSGGTYYDIDFTDKGPSLLSYFEYTVFTATGLGGTQIKSWTLKEANLSTESYTSDWTVDFIALQEETTNYVSVRVEDYAGNQTTAEDAFYVLKDTTSPGIGDNQPGDEIFRTSNTGTYDVDFTDTGGSKLEKCETQIWKGKNQTVGLTEDWTARISSINANTYSVDWAISTDTFNILDEGTSNYVTVIIYDEAGNTATGEDLFYISKDTVKPDITDSQSGDDTWQKTGGTVYNIDFADYGSKLSTGYYKVYTATGMGGEQIMGNTQIFADINSWEYTSGWTVDFSSLTEGINYVSVEIFDNVNSSRTVEDVFYVKKDTTSPAAVNNQTGDNTWRNTNDGIYDIDFNDATSGVVKYETRVSTLTGSAPYLYNWEVEATTDTNNYTDNWQISESHFNSLTEGVTNYISVRVVDKTTNTYELTDAFYILKDTTTPEITDNQPGDTSWRNSGGAVYDIDFTDTGGSLLDSARYKVYAEPSMGGSEILGWTDIFTSAGVSAWTAGWEVDFTALKSSYNYVSVEVTDFAGSSLTLTDAFFVKKDTAMPVITDNQAGVDSWIKTSGSVYDVDFTDEIGGLTGAEYTLYESPAMAGAEIMGWTEIFTAAGGTYAYTTDWEINFSSAITGINYVTVKTYDLSGATVTAEDLFYVKKDTVSPIVTDTQPGDDIWRNSTGTVYDIDFTDPESGLSGASYAIYENTGRGGNILKSWTLIPGISGTSFTADWEVDFSTLPEGESYVSVKTWDNLNSTKTAEDLFYVRKDTTTPDITNNATWNENQVFTSDPGSIFDVDFTDSGYSNLDYAQYQVWDSTGRTGAKLKDWANIFTSTDVASYTQDWPVDFGALLQTPTTNYVSVRVYDFSGNFKYSTDTFKVFKSTPTPKITDNQLGDDTWRNSGGTTYDIDFSSNSPTAQLSYFDHKITAGPGQTGDILLNWTKVADINAPEYTTDWEINFSSCSEGINYVSVWIYDSEGHNTEVSDLFYVKKDTTLPVATDNQSGDDTWRYSNSGYYNIDFNDAVSGSGLENAEYKIVSDTGGVIVDWSNIGGISGYSYSDDWQVSDTDFSKLNSGSTNFVSIRVYDYTGSSDTLNDVFYILKDTIAPVITDNQSGDDIWRVGPGAVYDMDFTDSGGALLDNVQYRVCLSSGGSGEIVSWTDIVSGLNASFYTTDWEVDYENLSSSINYVSVRAFDFAGTSATLTDAFYIKKDSAAPVVSNNQSGDDTWRETDPGNIYDVDFTDSGSSKLDKAYYKIYDSTGMEGAVIQSWTEIFSSLNSDSYSTNWGINFFNANEGYNYVSVRVWDNAGSSVTAEDVFYLKKDTLSPDITNNQSGDDTWRNAGGTVYDVDFSDYGSMLDSAAYTVWTDENKTGTQILDWITIASNIESVEYTSDWDVLYSSLTAGKNYVSVRGTDYLGHSAANDDVFYILKDETPPQITDNQTGDDTWKNTGGTTYDIDFSDTLSKLTTAYYSIYTSTYITGAPVAQWSEIFSSTGTASYTTDWEVNFSSCVNGTNYIFLKVKDSAGNINQPQDYLFYVKKDTSPPLLVDNQPGDDTWRKETGTTYDVDFTDNWSQIDWLKYSIWDSTGRSGVELTTWTYIVSSVNSTDYTTDWEINFSSVISGTNYVSVKAADNLGNNTVYEDVFYVKKDTAIPLVVDNQSGDDNWKSSGGTVYDVDFSDGLSGLTTAWYIIYPSSGMADAPLKDWTEIDGVAGAAWTTDWEISFPDCQEGMNYISVSVYDGVNNSITTEDVFYVKKDITNPGYTDNQAGDDTWRSQPGTTYDVDFSDTGGANLDMCEYKIYDGTNPATAGMVIDWTVIKDTVDAGAYNTDWEVDFSQLNNKAYNYVWIRAYDNAGNSVESSGYVFYIKKSITTPQITDNQSGDDNWRYSNSGLYDIDFSSDGPSALSYFQTSVWTSTGMAGVNIETWTTVVNNINSSDYTVDWNILDETFTLLHPATNYVSVKIVDEAGNSSTLEDAFYVLKDTDSPIVSNNQTGDNTWRNSTGTVYDVDFIDYGPSLLKNIRYLVYSSSDMGGNEIISWTDIATNIDKSSYTADWQVDFSSLTAGINYVSVRCFDNALSSYTLKDAFYIKKDTIPSQIVNNESGGDFVWRNTSAEYDVDFTDHLSLLTTGQYIVYDSTRMGGNQVKGWTNIFSGVSTDTYNAGWLLDFNALLEETTNYVSIRVYDHAGNQTTAEDAFYVLKDTTSPGIGDNQPGDEIFKTSNTGTYDVDFTDTGGSKLEKCETRVWKGKNQTVGLTEDWTVQVSSINADSYSAEWTISTDTFNSLDEGASNYVTVKVYDEAGNTATGEDLFYISKDTVKPDITDSQSGDDTWRKTGGTVYN
ncbi:MAG: hypothetical protein PF545_06225, partial [Elusimicrobia bacterium]|nr:hypothetical protein [Elusimicrobiota bacterium]